MSNKTQLQTNNTKYASLIETLRGKAVGGGSSDGASIDTCTVTITTSSTSILGTTYTKFIDNKLISESTSENYSSLVLEDIVIGSAISVFMTNFMPEYTMSENISTMYQSDTAPHKMVCFAINGEGTIHIVDND
jgi:hypothetical protein